MTYPPIGVVGPAIALHCACTNGERVTVLVADGEPWWDASGNTPFRIVRRDGTVVLEDVVEARVSRGTADVRFRASIAALERAGGRRP